MKLGAPAEWVYYELIASKTRSFPVILNEVKDLFQAEIGDCMEDDWTGKIQTGTGHRQIEKEKIMKISEIEQIAVNVPYLERIREHLRKGWNFGNRATDDELEANRSEFERQWQESSPPSVQTLIYRVQTDEGLVGIGEGAGIPEDRIQTYLGRSPFEFIMDDSAGPLQIAFYDLMGQAVGLPMARLFGPCQETVPIAYWSHCFPPDVLEEEVKIAIENDFRAHKFKRRAHTDVVEQVQRIADAAPDDYELTIDANCTFGTVERALSIGRQLKKYPQVKCLESPIDQENVEGYLTLKKELGYPLAIHFGSPHPMISLPSSAYDYYVVGGWAAGVIRCANIASAANKPFWMQMGFTGISAVFMVHLAATIPNASLGHVSLYMLLEHSLLAEPLVVKDGQAKVPERPGLGVALDMDAVERYRLAGHKTDV
jgi:L-alanine-DL-glutamate epimerase-like enolase superfamily enzyme